MRFTPTLCYVLLCNLCPSPLLGVKKTPLIPRLNLPQESAQKTNSASRPHTIERTTVAANPQEEKQDTRPHTVARSIFKETAFFLDRLYPGTEQSFRSTMPMHPKQANDPELKAILEIFS